MVFVYLLILVRSQWGWPTWRLRRSGSSVRRHWRVPLAEWLRRATEQLAARVGSAIGGLLNVTFGNMAELILTIVVLSSGKIVGDKPAIAAALLLYQSLRHPCQSATRSPPRFTASGAPLDIELVSDLAPSGIDTLDRLLAPTVVRIGPAMLLRADVSIPIILRRARPGPFSAAAFARAQAVVLDESSGFVTWVASAEDAVLDLLPAVAQRVRSGSQHTIAESLRLAYRVAPSPQ